MRIVDLSGPIETGLWTYGPPNPPVTVETIATIDMDGFEAGAIHLSALTGSYLETSAHLIKGQWKLDEVPPERFISEAVVARVPKGPLGEITLSDLRPYGDQIRNGDAFLVGTGWDREWNGPRYLLESPHFSLDAVVWLRDLGVTLLGGDIPYYNDPRGGEVNVITEFYRRPENMIVAPLVNVTRISRTRVRLLTLPLKLKGQCVAPCRVLALEY